MNVENASSDATESLALNTAHAADMVETSMNARLELMRERDALVTSCSIKGEWIGSTQDAVRLAGILAALDGLIDNEVGLGLSDADGPEVETTIELKLAGFQPGATVRVRGDSETVLALQSHLGLFEFDDSALIALPEKADVLQVFGEPQAIKELDTIVQAAWKSQLDADLARCAENDRAAQSVGRARSGQTPVMVESDPMPKVDPEARARRFFAAKDGKPIEGPALVWGETRRTATEIEASIRELEFERGVLNVIESAKAGRGVIMKIDPDFDLQAFIDRVVLGLRGEH